ncbi:MAG: prepilin-type N-terminal cleavage/methylation domain-containing protein, partial [Verrucomicrobiota bacterium]
TPFPGAFTLVELIIVMALLATVMALSAPSLSRSLRQRNLDHEAVRFVALTEYARNEAVSQGVPMFVWINPETSGFGTGPKTGYRGVEGREREYTINPDLHFEMDQAQVVQGLAHIIEFAPDGSPGTLSTENVRIIDRFNSNITVALTSDRWCYEILKETK